MLRTKYIVYALIAVEMKPQFLAIVAIMATIGLMTTATIAVPMLEDGNGLMQTARAVITSDCGAYYNPGCSQGWWTDAPQTP